MEKIDTIEHNGYGINVYQDDNAEGPAAWGDDGLFLVGYHRDFYVENKKVSKEEVQMCFSEELEPEERARVKELKREYWIFPLEAYIHSGVVLSLGENASFPDRRWDVSALGAVFVSKKEWRLSKKAEEAGRGLVKEWNQYLSGEVYGYMIQTPDGDEEGGCWGFYGYDHEASGLLDHARSEADAMKAERDAKRAVALERIKSGSVRVYDTGPDTTIDRYTVINGTAAYGMSADPKSPQGFNQYIGESGKLSIPALGKKISAGKIPAAVREAIIDRIV